MRTHGSNTRQHSPLPKRRVKIEGEGFFDVKPDATKPFHVEIPGGESIRVLGTSFNVSAYSG
ncbi:MAG: FecR domain-containing protein [Butyricimonas paravirosa]